MDYQILDEADLARVLKIEDAIRKVEDALRAHSDGNLVAPPRHTVNLDDDALVFTIGGENTKENVIGFRVYDTYRVTKHDQAQLTAVYDTRSGEFKGLVIGRSLGAIRTGAIGGVAVKYLSRADSKCLALLGTGFQARFQLMAANAVRDFERILIYSPTARKRQAFVAEMQEKLGRDLEELDNAEEAVRAADVLLCATSQSKPIFDARWLKRGTHITTIGPKFKDAHEIPPEVIEMSQVLVTDSFVQLENHGKPNYLEGTTHRERLIQLGDVVTGKQAGRTSDDDITLFVSVGLAGTEVYVANEVLRLAREE